MSNYHLSRIATLVCSASLIACGGGGGSNAPVQTQAAPIAASSTSLDAAVVVATGPDTSAKKPVAPPPTTGVPAPIAGAVAITDIKLQSTGSAEQRSVPVTFGQPFAKGQLLPTKTLVGRLADGTMVALQVDNKATHPDGSIRHAVISTILPVLAALSTQGVELVATDVAAPTAAVSPDTLIRAGFSSTVNIDIAGQRYTASAQEQLSLGKYTTWLSGPIVNEWHVLAPLKNANGEAHPHLVARYAVRAYRGNAKVRVDVTVENNWAYEASPQNFVYDAQVQVGGVPVYSKTGLTHFHHARWRKVFWSGGEPAVHLKHNVPYLISTRALPNFDQSIVFAESNLATLKSNWSKSNTEPMGTGMALTGMPTAGGRDDIGLLPAWAATYLLTQDQRAKEVTLGTADLAGSYSSHFRDRITDRPVSTADYPYMTLLGTPNDTRNPVTGKLEAFPTCPSAILCYVPTISDTSHQPAFAYLPYLVTGDYYYLEELQFWAMYDTFADNPYYREFGKSLVKPDQVRGQAWSLRTIGEAAYITPDSDRLKSHLVNVVDNNLEYYNTTYVTGTVYNNVFGILTNGYAIGYENSTAMAPWMDDFFTSAVGHLTELGFTKAAPLLAWKAKFPVSRMVGPDTCWISGAMYTLKIRETSDSPLYTSMAQAYKASAEPLAVSNLGCNSTQMATVLGLSVGEMSGYSGVTTGYPSNMQPALAYAAGVPGLKGSEAWAVFMARSVKPNYAFGPQFAIVPR